MAKTSLDIEARGGSIDLDALGGDVFPFDAFSMDSDTSVLTLSSPWTLVATPYAPVAGEPSLGTGHWFPRTDTTSRLIVNALACPAASAWSAAKTAQGPVGIKEILVDVIFDIDPTAAGAALCDIHFSDNNTTTPSYTTSHPFVTASYTAASATDLHRFNKELHVPVDSSGQFYIYCSTKTNIGSATIYVTQKKYFC